MSDLKPLAVYERIGRRYSLVRGHLRPVIEGTSIVATWSITERGWLIRSDRVGDLLAMVDERGGYHVRLRRMEVVAP